MARIFASLLAAPPLELQQAVTTLEPHVAGFHLDVMDFHFVPNLGLSFDIINALRDITTKPFHVHLMVDYPEQYFDRLHLNQGDMIAIHYECHSENTPADNLAAIASASYLPSIALNPETEITVLEELHCEHLLLMGVHPGFSGQPFIEDTYTRLIQAHQLVSTICVDGGVSENNANKLIQGGAQELVIGSALFNSSDQKALLQRLQSHP